MLVRDAKQQLYADKTIRRCQASFRVRGEAGWHRIEVVASDGPVLEKAGFRVKPQTELACDRGHYASLFEKIQRMIEQCADWRPYDVAGRSYRMLVCWSRDHVYTLKAAKYFVDDVQSGIDYYLDRQLPSGMLWDCLYPNTANPAPTWFAEALGDGWFSYDDGMKFNLRRVPVLADTEYVWAEGVWAAWKASGDDAWMQKQLLRLEKALKYLTSDPLRWSRKEGLIRRSFTMDEWDFANPHYCAGDSRCIYPGDATFLFHGNQSGLYGMYLHMAEMHERAGNSRRAKELRNEAAELRDRSNKRRYFRTNYGHMIPEELPEKEVYALVGDERKRMSLSTGYTINRGLPTHAMSVKILKEYQKRGKSSRRTSFAEWWATDPMYTPAQFPGRGSRAESCPEGEYMNGGITPLGFCPLAPAKRHIGMYTAIRWHYSTSPAASDSSRQRACPR